MIYGEFIISATRSVTGYLTKKSLLH